MKLSEAILKGCESTVPIYGELFIMDGETPGACALGAAMVGRFGLEKVTRWWETGVLEEDANTATGWEDEFPDLNCMLSDVTVREYIIDSNDHHKLSREAIAAELKKGGF